jgi:flagellar hook-basal body complex protein FliE
MEANFLNTAINGVLPAVPFAGADAASVASGAAPSPFSGVFHEALGSLQGLEEEASSTIEGLVAGRGVDIHAAMIATEKSDMAFEMALAVRGKLVSAYQALMGVQF